MRSHLDSGTLFLPTLLAIKCCVILVTSSLDDMVWTHYLATVMLLHWHLFEECLRLDMLLREIAIDNW